MKKDSSLSVQTKAIIILTKFSVVDEAISNLTLRLNSQNPPILISALETVTEGVTGTFFKEPVPEALAEAVARIDNISFDPVTIRRHAEKFDTKVFESNLRDIVARLTTGRFTPSDTT